MNMNDMNRLMDLNERYTAANMTGFRIVTAKTDIRTVLKHFRTDLEILKTSDVKNKKVVRVIMEEDIIDICSHDNGTPVTYFFTGEARFMPDDIMEDVKEICGEFEVGFNDFRQVE